MKKGFTVAEVVMVLIVIGVLSAILIPSLSKSGDVAKIRTAIKKGHSLLASTYAMEFVAKPAPTKSTDSDKMMKALTNHLNIKYYLVCNEGKCEQKYEPQDAPAWIITEDSLAFKVMEGGADCADKLALNKMTNSKEISAATCLTVMIDALCIASKNDEKSCSEIEDGTDSLASDIKNGKFSGSQVRTFVALTGIATGDTNKTAAGILTSQL